MSYEIKGARKAIIIGGAHTGSVGQVVSTWLSSEAAFIGNGRIMVPSHAELDVTDPEQCDTYFSEHSDADVLVLSQGRTSMAPFEAQSLEQISDVINTNLFGTIYAAQSFVRATKGTSHRKQIVIISSLGAERVFTNSSIYCASKAAISHLAKCMAWELEPEYNVFAVEPGNIQDTPLSRRVMAGMPDPARFNKHNKRDAVITVEDIADVVLHLLDEGGSWMSGEAIRLSGGDRG